MRGPQVRDDTEGCILLCALRAERHLNDIGLPEEVVNMASNYYAELEREHEQKEQLWRNHMRSERRLKKKAVAVG